jgi:hypothetical protein
MALDEIAQHGAVILSDLGELAFDATLREDHSRSVEATRKPLDDGARVTDHAFVQPLQLTLLNMIAATPLSATGADPGREARLYEQLLRIMHARQPVSVVTTLGQYDDMLIVDIATPVDADTGSSIVPAVRLEEVRFANSATVDVPPEFLAPVVRPAVARTTTQAEQTATEPDAATQEAASERTASLAARLDDAAGGRLTGGLGAIFGLGSP